MALVISPEVSSFQAFNLISFSYKCSRRTISKLNFIRNEKTTTTTTTVKITLCSGVKDLEDAKGLNFGNYIGNFSALVTEPSTSSSSKQDKDDEEEKRNYYLNMGYAIRCLREEFPALFNKEPSFDIYRDDIIFKDPLNTFSGIENYKSIFWALRFHGKMFFKELWIDIISVWQPVDNMIIVRWTVHGIPRVPWESQGRFDGTSEYKLDKYGKIYEHRVHNIAFTPPKFKIQNLQDMIQSIACSSTPKPTYFESSTSSFQKIMQQVDFTGIEDYVSSLFTQKGSDADPQQR